MIESIYMMKYFNEKWTALTTKFQDIADEMKSCLTSFLPMKAKAQVNAILRDKDFLEKGQIVHATMVKELQEHLRPVLASEKDEDWNKKGYQNLRSNLKELYTTYTSLVKLGSYLNARNTKFKEYHEDELLGAAK